MRRIIAVCFFQLIFVFGMCAGDGISFINQNLKKALKKAKKENKIIFVDAYTTWCGPCKWMASNVFTDKEVSSFYNDNFINLKLDMEEGEGIEFASEYGVNAFPTLLYLDANGEVVHKGLGARDVTDFIDLGKTAMDPNKRLSYFTNNYEAKKNDPAFLKDYALSAREANMRNYKEIGQEYLSHVENWLQDTATAKFAFNVMETDVESKSFKYVYENRAGFYDFISEDRVDNVLAMIVSNSVEDGGSPDEVALKLLNYFPNKGEKMVATQTLDRLMYSSSPGDVRAFADFGIKYVDMYNPQDANLLNGIAWHYFEVIKDKEYLKKAVNIALKSVEIESSFFNNDTAAAIYYRIGDKPNAIKYADEAIRLGKKDGMDTSETEELLEKINMLD